ncbi:MAG: hypothetical protein IJW28_02800 [Clostridia bacterium]|nr:hypothetical protein [Clostridia bacterium]
MINKLRAKNKIMLIKYTKEHNSKLVTKHKIIHELLKRDDCFTKLTLEEAYTILQSLDIKDWKETYEKLVSPKK